MGGPILYSAERVLILKQTLDLWRAASQAWFNDHRFASRADDLFICWALMVGTCEGRLMNASKLADFAGLPRPTVLRKLRRLQDDGIVIRVDQEFAISADFANAPQRLRLVEFMQRRIVDGGAKLSKMDSLAIDA